jgi:hypothetical protein
MTAFNATETSTMPTSNGSAPTESSLSPAPKARKPRVSQGIRLVDPSGNIKTEWPNLSQASKGTGLSSYSIMQRVVSKLTNADGTRFEAFESPPTRVRGPGKTKKPTSTLKITLAASTLATLDTMAAEKDMTVIDFLEQLLDHNYGQPDGFK